MDRCDFYNPFPSRIMLNVVAALNKSIQKIDRELVIIYNNATCNDVVIGQGLFEKIGGYPYQWGNGIFIYSNDEFLKRYEK